MKLRHFLATGALALGLAAPAMAQQTNPNPPYTTIMLETLKFTFHNPEGTWVRHTSGYTTMAACLADGATFASYYAVTQNVDYRCTTIHELVASDPPPATW